MVRKTCAIAGITAIAVCLGACLTNVRQNKRSGKEFLRAFRQGQRAVKHFKAVGLSSPNRAITQTP